eukprot:CAMPEP_0197520590 /NCGR_PEP_ID=MMETSP1318-20131121/5937_1 /TAXON_ID=552666 /ORGANISM="Partenskyella glossopodia, Strain RCC365" /LENGTH=225 /DNA_ID=CAMNT_0043072243 /DNA_START=40 /DNA_END=717 /DNA_ORIENTATION=+
MAWRSSGGSNEDLVQNLCRNGLIKTKKVADAMASVDRICYCGGAPAQLAYRDNPMSIGYNATISAPHMHAWCLELMDIKEGQCVLDVGSGSGYLTACMAQLVGPQGKAYGVEHVKELVEFSKNNIAKDRPDLKNWSIETADGRLGLPKSGPFNAIHVGAAAGKIPMELLKQLADNGRLVIPVGLDGGTQYLYIITREGNNFRQQKVTGVRYVPLCDLKSQVEVSE